MTKARLCVPGSELPEWVKYSGVGSFLQVKKSSRIMVDDRCRLAFCVVVVSITRECDQQPNKFGVKCKWVGESGEEFVSSCYNSLLFVKQKGLN